MVSTTPSSRRSPTWYEVVGLALRDGPRPAHYVTLPQWTNALPIAWGCGGPAAKDRAGVRSGKHVAFAMSIWTSAAGSSVSRTTDEFSAFNPRAVCPACSLRHQSASSNRRTADSDLCLPTATPENRRAARKSARGPFPPGTIIISLTGILDSVMTETVSSGRITPSRFPRSSGTSSGDDN
jgi:hypothetical protein